jgi:hypothetical protein
MNPEIVCTTEADFTTAAGNLKTQGFNMIAPNFAILKEINSSIELPIKAKVILSGNTNERGWQICLLDFDKGRISVEKPDEFPIGSLCRITYNGLVKNNKGKDVKDFKIEVLTASTPKATKKAA